MMTRVQLALFVALVVLLTACGRSQPSTPEHATVLPSPSPSATATTALPTLSATPVPRVGDSSIGDPKAPELGNTGYDVQQYNLALTIDPLAETLSGTVTVEALTTLADLGRFSLDFSGDYQIARLTVDGQPATYQWSEDKLFVDLPQSLPAETPFSLAVHYSGHPQPIRSRYLTFIEVGLTFDAGAAYVIAEPDGARAWFPANDHPRDKARFRFEITVPQPYVVAANGQPEPPTDHGDGTITYVWNSDKLMAPYLATVAVDEFTVIEQTAPNGVPIRHFAPPEIADEAADFLGVTGEMMVFLEHYFGPYPFDSYGHALTPVEGVALETQTMTILPANIVLGEGEGVILHELAHQWFGDSVSPASWADIWLNEGFATYAEWLWLEARLPQALSARLDSVEVAAPYSDLGAPLADPAPSDLFGFNSYQKGAWVLHMLRQHLGDDVFFQLLQTYHEWFQGGVASSADFQQVAEEVSGQDLDEFFDQWVYGRGIPELALYWRQADEAVELRVCQSQAQTFTLALTLVLQGQSQNETVTITLDEVDESARLPVRFPVTNIFADPDQSILAQVAVEERNELPDCP